MLIRLYNYFDLILVFCICLLVAHFCQWSLTFTNNHLLLPMVFFVTCNHLSLLTHLRWMHLAASMFGIIDPWPLMGLGLFFCPICPLPVGVREFWDYSKKCPFYPPLLLYCCWIFWILVYVGLPLHGVSFGNGKLPWRALLLIASIAVVSVLDIRLMACVYGSRCLSNVC